MQGNAQQSVQKYQQIQQQLQQVQEYIDQVENSVDQVQETRKAVTDLEQEEVGSEILVPLGSGVFAVGELQDNENVVVNVGGEAFEKKELDGADDVLEERIGELRDTQDQLQGTMEELQQEMQKIQQQIQEQRQQQEQ